MDFSKAQNLSNSISIHICINAVAAAAAATATTHNSPLPHTKTHKRTLPNSLLIFFPLLSFCCVSSPLRLCFVDLCAPVSLYIYYIVYGMCVYASVLLPTTCRRLCTHVFPLYISFSS